MQKESEPDGGPPLRLHTGGYAFPEVVTFHDDVKASLFPGSWRKRPHDLQPWCFVPWMLKATESFYKEF